MPTAYRVMRKAHMRTSRIPQQVTFPNGTVGVVMQPGPMVTVPKDAILDDVTAEELAAFPDRFQVATSDEVAAWERQKETVRETFLPGVGEPVDPKRLELEQQIGQLQAQLAAMPNPDVTKRLLEHAPVDPVTAERAALEREALRQAVADHQQEVLKAEGTGQPPPSPTESTRSSSSARTEGTGAPPSTTPESPDESTNPPRRGGERNVAGGARTEERK